MALFGRNRDYRMRGSDRSSHGTDPIGLRSTEYISEGALQIRLSHYRWAIANVQYAVIGVAWESRARIDDLSYPPYNTEPIIPIMN